jgi:hypothetical protein
MFFEPGLQEKRKILSAKTKNLPYLLLTLLFNTVVGFYLVIYHSDSAALLGKLFLIPGNIIAIIAFYLRRKFASD